MNFNKKAVCVKTNCLNNNTIKIANKIFKYVLFMVYFEYTNIINNRIFLAINHFIKIIDLRLNYKTSI